MAVKKTPFIFFIIILVFVYGFQVIREPETDVYHEEAVFDTGSDFDTLKFVNEVTDLHLYTTNKESYKYSIYYSEAGEGFWSVEFFFDSLYNFKSYYVIDGHGGEELIKYSVFKNDSMIYLVDSLDYGEVRLKRFARILKDYKGVEEYISYKYDENEMKSKEVTYKLLTKLDFEKEEQRILNELIRRVQHVKNNKQDFNYKNYLDKKINHKFIYSDTVQMTPYENNITDIIVDSALFVKIMDNTCKY